MLLCQAPNLACALPLLVCRRPTTDYGNRAAKHRSRAPGPCPRPGQPTHRPRPFYASQSHADWPSTEPVRLSASVFHFATIACFAALRRPPTLLPCSPLLVSHYVTAPQALFPMFLPRATFCFKGRSRPLGGGMSLQSQQLASLHALCFWRVNTSVSFTYFPTSNGDGPTIICKSTWLSFNLTFLLRY